VIAHLLQPALFHDRHINVEIETKGEHTPGTTVADGWRVTKRAPKAVVMGGSGPGGVLPVVERAVGGYEETSWNHGL
jgi:purine nucleosidase